MVLKEGHEGQDGEIGSNQATGEADFGVDFGEWCTARKYQASRDG